MVRKLIGLLILIAVARIVSTYWTFNHTMDEPSFLAAGFEWLDNRTYTFMPEQPPLSHIPAVIGAKLAGARNVAQPYQAPLILYNAPSYWRALAGARAGELPFFILAAWVVWLWARRLHGDLAGFAAVLLFTTQPVVLGHAGLATTDIALCAMVPAALYAFLVWLDKPAVRQTLWLAFAIAGGVLAKFSFLLFFPVSVVVILLIRRPRPSRSHFIMLSTAAAGSFLVIWAAYWFQLHPLFQGLQDLRDHNYYGHLSYLFGEQRTTGWWYFFPVVLALKTPLTFLVLAALAFVWLRRGPRDQWIPLACAAAILIGVMPSRIDIGVRHILPVYALLAIPAGLAAARLIQSAARVPRIAGGFLVLAQIAISAAAHPDYIAYFNELALGHPELIRVDSDLDWGQNFDRLAARLRARGITDTIGLGMFGCVDPSRHGLGNAYAASPWQASSGWIAVSATERYMSDQKPPAGSNARPWAWLDRYAPVERIGNGAVLLYFVPKPQ